MPSRPRQDPQRARSGRTDRAAKAPGRPRRRTARPAKRPPASAPLPHCPHFGICGGCSLLDVPIGDQLVQKLAALENRVGRFLGEATIDWEPPSRTPLHFRTRLLYPIRKDRDGRAVLGIYARHTHTVVPIHECRTQDPGLTAFGVRAGEAIRSLGLPPFDERDGSGVLRSLWGRLCAGTGELLLGVTTTPGVLAAAPALADALLDAARGLPHLGERPTRAVGVVRSISDRDDLFQAGDRHVPLRGRDWCTDRRDGLSFRIGAGSFHQIHREASALLYRPAMRLLGDVRGLTVVDGYGGVGAFGLRLARAGARAVAIVEDNPGACRDAEHNARDNRLPGITVVKAPFARAEFAAGPDLLVVDPPRAGLGADGVARALAAAPRRLLHVACAADALAHDLEALTAGGYRVTACRLCDLFPHTEHVEVVTLLERAG